MGEYNVTLLDAGVVALVIVIVQRLKPYIRSRWVPLLPWPVSAVLAGCAVIAAAGGWPGWSAFMAQTFLETLKVAFSSMGLFKIYKTTLRGE
ncbi:MAG TPA: hypothetical protein GXX51_12325 [Firmicutes bacterium]|nr:hypothetical protein [Bacillota bacterium]